MLMYWIIRHQAITLQPRKHLRMECLFLKKTDLPIWPWVGSSFNIFEYFQYILAVDHLYEFQSSECEVKNNLLVIWLVFDWVQKVLCLKILELINISRILTVLDKTSNSNEDHSALSILSNVYHVYQALLSIMAKESNYLPNKFA